VRSKHSSSNYFIGS